MVATVSAEKDERAAHRRRAALGGVRLGAVVANDLPDLPLRRSRMNQGATKNVMSIAVSVAIPMRVET